MQRHALLPSAIIALLAAWPKARSADDATDEAVKKYKEALKGEWQMTSRIENGVPSEAEVIKKRTITFEGDKYTVRNGEAIFAQVTYKIDPTKKPAWLDITFIVPEDTNPDKGI